MLLTNFSNAYRRSSTIPFCVSTTSKTMCKPSCFSLISCYHRPPFSTSRFEKSPQGKPVFHLQGLIQPSKTIRISTTTTAIAIRQPHPLPSPPPPPLLLWFPPPPPPPDEPPKLRLNAVMYWAYVERRALFTGWAVSRVSGVPWAYRYPWWYQ